MVIQTKPDWSEPKETGSSIWVSHLHESTTCASSVSCFSQDPHVHANKHLSARFMLRFQFPTLSFKEVRDSLLLQTVFFKEKSRGPVRPCSEDWLWVIRQSKLWAQDWAQKSMSLPREKVFHDPLHLCERWGSTSCVPWHSPDRLMWMMSFGLYSLFHIDCGTATLLPLWLIWPLRIWTFSSWFRVHCHDRLATHSFSGGPPCFWFACE
jgi:hypothetical protein